MTRLDPKAAGLACGAVWALGVVLLALVSMFHGSYGNTIISIASSVYLGYRNTIPGAVIGGLWALADGFICGYLFAWLYNRFLTRG